MFVLHSQCLALLVVKGSWYIPEMILCNSPESALQSQKEINFVTQVHWKLRDIYWNQAWCAMYHKRLSYVKCCKSKQYMYLKHYWICNCNDDNTFYCVSSWGLRGIVYHWSLARDHISRFTRNLVLGGIASTQNLINVKFFIMAM